jgi:hypothetical protein
MEGKNLDLCSPFVSIKIRVTSNRFIGFGKNLVSVTSQKEMTILANFESTDIGK